MKQVLFLSSLIQDDDDETLLPAASDDEATCKLSTRVAVDETDNDASPISLEELPQKNTFIHYDTRDKPPTPTSSAPGVMLSRLFKTKASDVNTKADIPTTSFSCESVHSTDSTLTDNTTAHKDDFDRASDVSTQYSTADSNTGTPLDLCVASTADFPVDMKTAVWEQHQLGQCTPCNYFWYKVDGCRQGSECCFCHFCPKGEIKKRKKDKLRQLRKDGAVRYVR